MTQHTTVMDLADTFETIEEAKDQRDAVISYSMASKHLARFIQWYVKNDLSYLSDKLDYVQSKNFPVTLSSQLSDLEALYRYNDAGKIKILNRLLSVVDSKSMMLLENALTKDLKTFYPNIDWTIFEEIFKVEI